MGLGTNAKHFANKILERFNVHVDSLTYKRLETARLSRLVAANYFSKLAFPVLPQFEACDPTPILQEISRTATRISEIAAGENNNGFVLENSYFSTPDAEVLYAVVQLYQPVQIIEIGSGHSTRLFRCAIHDAGLQAHLASIDPSPRCEVADISDKVICAQVENLVDFEIFESLRRNDILFIDSSHEIRPGNDVLYLFFSVIPRLASGVLVHLHDIFLPYEYPKRWVVENGWNFGEQYLLQALLSGSNDYEVLWPGYYLQRHFPTFARHFSQLQGSLAKSLWMRKA